MYDKILKHVNVFNPVATAYNLGKLSSDIENKEKYSGNYPGPPPRESRVGSLHTSETETVSGIYILFIFFIIFIVFLLPYILNFYYAYKNWNVITTVWKVVWVLSLIMFGPIISGIVLISGIAFSKT